MAYGDFGLVEGHHLAEISHHLKVLSLAEFSPAHRHCRRSRAVVKLAAMTTSEIRNRRQFLRFLAASPLLANPGVRAWAQQIAASKPAGGGGAASAKDFLSVMDFEPAAKAALAPAHWGYMTSGVDDDLTKEANMAAFKHFQLKPRRLVDVSKPDLKLDVFGATWDMPIFICPVGSQMAFNPEGEVAVARAARAKKAMQILSTATTKSVEEVATALGTPPWYQLYMPLKWEDTEKLVKRVENAGCPALAWTVDLLAGRNTETDKRFRREDKANCISCHTNGPGTPIHRPMLEGIDSRYNPPEATWAYVGRLKKITKMKILLKGLDNAEDAKLAVDNGADGIILSNHGGRAAETLRATIDCLPEVVEAVNGRIPVFVDGGFRRGTDVFKALAMGAKAVGIGRPYIWGLSAFGQDGVERVLDILRAELTLTMRQMGAPTIRDIRSSQVVRA
jgi:isopentenyl diphosphate isomerase/L-lactate dehydrogenase-like FMN-dependent dehydrogenase